MQDLDMLGAESAVGLETMDILKTLPGVLQATGQTLSAQSLTLKKAEETKKAEEAAKKEKEPAKDSGGASKPQPPTPPSPPPTAASVLASMPLGVKVGGGVALGLIAWRLLRSKG